MPSEPPLRQDPLRSGLTDDLRLAHLLVDDADAISMISV